MVTSSKDLFPEHRESREFHQQRIKSSSSMAQSCKDSLSKFRQMEFSNIASSSNDSPITTLSIGGKNPRDSAYAGRGGDAHTHQTNLRLKTWSNSYNSENPGQVLTGQSLGVGEYSSHNSSKGLKRKRAVGSQYGMESDGEEESARESGIMLGLSTHNGSSANVDAILPFSSGLNRGMWNETCSGNSDDFSHDMDTSTTLIGHHKSIACEAGEQVLLRLGNSSESAHHLDKLLSSKPVGEGICLGLGPMTASTLDTKGLERTLDGVPVVDEGSSSARLLKSGGFMPTLLMGTSLYVPENQRTVKQNREMSLSVADEEILGEHELSMSIKASTSGTTSTSGASGLSDRASKICKFRGCGKGARGASGLCIAHGGGRRCQKSGCNKGAEGRTVYCKAHGGGRRCQNLGCTKSAEGKTDYCIGHGGGRRCSHDGCDKAARGRSGLCIRHGGGKRCQVRSCTKSAEGYSGLCISHGGGRRCQFTGCSKGAQGSTMYCKAHGGGKRCMIIGCNKGAEGSTPLCKGHGGGKRCMHDGGGMCTKSVHGGTHFCVAHGGGKRCLVEGCSKSARGRTDFCVRHGGGKRCKFDGCGKSAQGSTDFCKAHGGGKRCQWGVESLGFGEVGRDVCEKFARGKTGLCAAHTAQVQDRRVHGGTGLGSGITPGLFRGLVTGSNELKLSMGASSSMGKRGSNCSQMDKNHYSDSLESGISERLNLGTFSKGQGSGSLLSALTNVGLGNSPSSTGGCVDLSTPTTGFDLHKTIPSLPTLLPSFGPSLIPPQVLVPLSMQKRDSSVPAKLKHGRPPRTPYTSDDGVSNTGSGTLPEGRVHGGGLLAMLTHDARIVTAMSSVEPISLGMGPSKTTNSRWSQGLDESLLYPLTEADPQQLDRISSLGTDVGQFLATRVDFG